MTRALGRLAIILTLALLPAAGIAQAATITFTPNSGGLTSLDHDYAYEWEIVGFSLPAGQHIVSATLTYDNIYNWQAEPFTLYTRLLDTPVQRYGSPTQPYQNGRVTAFRDYDPWHDYFGGNGGVQLGPWQGNSGGSGSAIDLVYQINLTSYSSYFTNDGKFAFGIDPDCHFYDSGVRFDIVTEGTPEVPEPASLLLLGTGLIGVARAFRRRGTKA